MQGIPAPHELNRLVVAGMPTGDVERLLGAYRRSARRARLAAALACLGLAGTRLLTYSLPPDSQQRLAEWENRRLRRSESLWTRRTALERGIAAVRETLADRAPGSRRAAADATRPVPLDPRRGRGQPA